MACLARLRDDTKFLEKTFPLSHHRFQIISASVDEVSCRFLAPAVSAGSGEGEKIDATHVGIIFTANFGVCSSN